MRCDRQSPCSVCVRRGKPSECLYTTSEKDRKAAVDYRPHTGNQEARQRIVRLEKLVTQMRDQMKNMKQNSGQVSVSTSADNHLDQSNSQNHHNEVDLAQSVGKLSLTEDNAVYFGRTHWGTILEDVGLRSLTSFSIYSDTGAPRFKASKKICSMSTEMKALVQRQHPSILAP